MATPIKQIKTSDNTTHDIMADEYIVGTQSSATNMWKGASESDELYAGKVINYKLPIAGATNTNTHTGLTTNTTLELTLANGSTVVNPIYRNASTAITTHYPANSIIRMVFDPTPVTLNGHTFAGSWKTADYDANTTTTVQQSSTTTNGYLPLILKATTSTSTVTTSVRFNSNLTGNPSTGDIKLKNTTIKPTATTANTINLPTSSGTLALTSDIPTTLPPTAHTHSIGEVYNGTSALSVNTSASNVKMDGTASAGSGSALALANHVHPTDTSRAPLASPAFTGTPTAPTPYASASSTAIANKGYVDSVLGGITQVDYQVTTTLPTTGVKGTIYLVSHTHGTSDIYDEYIDTNQNGNWEKIGNTDVDLSDYIEIIDVGTVSIANGDDFLVNAVLGGVGTASITIPSAKLTEIKTKCLNNGCSVKITLSIVTENAGLGTISMPLFLTNYSTLGGNLVFSSSGLLVMGEDKSETIMSIVIDSSDLVSVRMMLPQKMTDVYEGLVSGYSVSSEVSSATHTIDIGNLQLYGGGFAGETVSIPSDLSLYTNDVGYITSSDIPSIYATSYGDPNSGAMIGGIFDGSSTTPFYVDNSMISHIFDLGTLTNIPLEQIYQLSIGANTDPSTQTITSMAQSWQSVWIKADVSITGIGSISVCAPYQRTASLYGQEVYLFYTYGAYTGASVKIVMVGFIVSAGNAYIFCREVPAASEIPTNVSDLTNDSGYLTASNFSTTTVYNAANITAVTGITNTTVSAVTSVSGVTFGISVNNGVLEIGSTIGVSSINQTSESVVKTVSTSGTSSVRGNSTTVLIEN